MIGIRSMRVSHAVVGCRGEQVCMHMHALDLSASFGVHAGECVSWSASAMSDRAHACTRVHTHARAHTTEVGIRETSLGFDSLEGPFLLGGGKIVPRIPPAPGSTLPTLVSPPSCKPAM